MDEYREYVASLAKTGNSEVLLFRSQAHAAVVIAAMFSRAKTDVRILTNQLQDATFGSPEVIDAALNYFHENQKVTLSILLESPVDITENKFLSAIHNAKFGPRTNLRLVPKSTRQDFKFNFVLADSEHYRYENPDKSAVAQFGNADMGMSIKNVFDEIGSKSISLQ